jgi:hypothetical protein
MRAWLVLLACAGCDGNRPADGDHLFATWEIASSRGTVDCAGAGATTVAMDVVDVSSGARVIDVFPCATHQGTSRSLRAGAWDVLIDLDDARGATVSQVDLATENITGSVDLGHVVFRLP